MNVALCEDNSGSAQEMCCFRKNKGGGGVCIVNSLGLSL